MKKILVSCGTMLATSLVVARKLRTECSKRGIDVIIDTCKTTEINERASIYDMLITTHEKNLNVNIPILSPVGFLTGFGIENTMEKIVTILRS